MAKLTPTELRTELTELRETIHLVETTNDGQVTKLAPVADRKRRIREIEKQLGMRSKRTLYPVKFG